MRPASLPASLVLLSVAAGCIDAIGFLSVSVFPANMTGNSVMLALSLLRLDVPGGTLAAAVLLAFCIGAGLAATLLRRAPSGPSPTIGRVIGAGGILLAACAIGLAVFGNPALPLAVVGSALVMGMQSAAASHLGIAGISTVVVTGTLTTAISRAVSPISRPGPSADRLGAKPSPLLPALSWLGYFVGALFGGLQVALPGGLPFLGAAILIGISAVLVRRTKSI